MKELVFDEGGRPYYDDDLQTLQAEAQTAATAVLAGLGLACAVSGCRVSGSGPYTLSPGLVWVGGQLLHFLGASGVTLPATLVVGDVTVVDERTYQTGDTKTCIQERVAVVQAGAVAGGLAVYATGVLGLRHALLAAQLEVGDVKWGRLVAASYDVTGLGVPGTAAWGWALCNGQNGTDDLRQRFVVSYDPDETDYAAVGQTGGEAAHTLSLPELPAHTHNAPDYGTPDITYASGSSGGNSPNSGRKKTSATSSAGGGQPHENRPPFYVLAARQWVGY